MAVRPLRSSAAATAWLLTAAAAAAPAARAQQLTPPAGVSAPSCTYDACALRLEGTRVVRGAAGAPAGRLGGPFGALSLAPLVAGSDSALLHARIFDREYGRGSRMILFGAIAAGVPLAITLNSGSSDDEVTGRDWAILAAAIPGLAVEIWGAYKVERARKALARAVWWYNRDLPR